MIKYIFKTSGLTLFLAVILSGCASIVSRSTYHVNVRTEPKGASISITNKKGNEIYKGSSPATVELKAGAGFFTRAEYRVRISAAGYEEKIVPINFKIDGWYWGNLLIGGLLGMLIIDPATGAMWKISDPIINEILVKNTLPTSHVPTLQIIDIASIPESYRDKLEQIK
jgi:hypothetical protein